MARTLFCLLLLALTPGVLLDRVWREGEVPCTRLALEANALPWSAHHPADLRCPNPNTGDALIMFLPWDITLRREWTGLRPPLWNPYAGIGAPLLANPQAGILDPGRLAGLALSAREAPAVRAWLKLLVAGWLMFGLVRHLGAARGAAVFGALAFQLGGYVVPWMQHPTGHVAAYLPGLVWAGLAVLGGGSGRACAGLAGVFALQFLAGHPETTLHITTVAVPVWLGLRARVGLRRWSVLAAGLVAGGLLAAPLLVPFLEYLASSHAAAHRAAAGDTWLPPAAAAAFFLPHLFGWPLAGDWSGPINPCETVHFAGLVPWLLAPAAWLCRRHRRVLVVLAATAALSLLAACGTPGFRWLLDHLPGYAIAANRRLTVGVVLAVTVAGALGLDALMRREQGARLTPVWLALALAALAAAGLGFAAAGWPGGTPGLARGWPAAALALGGTVAVLAVAPAGRRRRAAWLLLLVPLLTAELRLAWGGFHTTAPPDASLPTTPAIEALRRRWRPGDRLLALPVKGGQTVLPANLAQAFELSDLKIYDAIQNPDFYELFVGAVHLLPAAGVQDSYFNLFGARWLALPAALERFQSAGVLAPGEELHVLHATPRPARAIELLSRLEGGRAWPAGHRAAEIEVLDEAGRLHVLPVRIGHETADGGHGAQAAIEVESEASRPDGRGGRVVTATYRARFPWPAERGGVRALRIRNRLEHGRIHIAGLGRIEPDGRSSLEARAVPFHRGALWLYENPAALPRAFLLAGDPPLEDVAAHARAAEITAYEPDLVRIRGTARAGEILVLSDAWFPGWRATVESGGTSAEVESRRVLKAFRGVAVPEGPFTVTWRYEPASFTLGLALGALGVLALGGALLWRRPRPAAGTGLPPRSPR